MNGQIIPLLEAGSLKWQCKNTLKLLFLPSRLKEEKHWEVLKWAMGHLHSILKENINQPDQLASLERRKGRRERIKISKESCKIQNKE